MARQAKSVNVNSKKLSKEEYDNRLEIENSIKGTDTKLYAPRYLTDSQKQIFKFIKHELDDSKILGNLDKFILAQTSICIDRLQYIENAINEDLKLLNDKSFMSSKDKYTKDFLRCCNELCLSPQSRAKIALAGSQEHDSGDPTGDILNDDD